MEGLLAGTEFSDLVADAAGYDAFTLIDVGCSGGIDMAWRGFGRRLTAFAFDPNLAECGRLRAMETLGGVEYVPAFVGLPPDHPFMRRRAASPIASRNVWSRLSAPRSLEIRRRAIAAMGPEQLRELNLWDRTDLADPAAPVFLPDFLASRGVGDADFLKIDVDGEDFAVLSSMDDALDRLDVLGVGLEVNFDGSEGDTEHSFHNTDRFMRARGFSLFGLTVRLYSLAALPGVYTVDMPAETVFGRPMLGDALYLRDVGAAGNAAFAARISPGKLLKLAAIASVANVPDMAAEILLGFGDRLAPLIDVGHALDALAAQAQPNLSETLSYRDYMAAFEADAPMFYTREAAPPTGATVQGEYLGRLRPGPAGHREREGIVATPGVVGTVCFGPYVEMPPGLYSARFTIAHAPGPAPDGRVGLVDVCMDAGNRILAFQDFGRGDTDITLPFQIEAGSARPRVEFRAEAHGRAGFTVLSVRLSRGWSQAARIGRTDASAARIRALEAELMALRELRPPDAPRPPPPSRARRWWR